jgi:hypothetical protein
MSVILPAMTYPAMAYPKVPAAIDAANAETKINIIILVPVVVDIKVYGLERRLFAFGRSIGVFKYANQKTTTQPHSGCRMNYHYSIKWAVFMAHDVGDVNVERVAVTDGNQNNILVVGQSKLTGGRGVS